MTVFHVEPRKQCQKRRNSSMTTSRANAMMEASYKSMWAARFNTTTEMDPIDSTSVGAKFQG
jgi:hypothetical protein